MAVRLVPQLPVRVLSPTEFATRLRRIRGGQSTSWVADSHAVVSRVLGSSNDSQFDAPESTTAASPSPLRQNVEVVIGESPARDTSGTPWSLPDSDVQLLSPWSANPCPSSAGGDKKRSASPDLLPAGNTVTPKAKKAKKPTTAGKKRRRTIEEFFSRQR